MPSEIAKAYAKQLIDADDLWEAGDYIDCAIKEACKPLVEAVEKARIIYFTDGEIGVESESYFKIVNAAQKLKGESHATTQKFD
jgi:hypothetical protein